MDDEKRAKRTAYMREYRSKNADKINAYQRQRWKDISDDARRTRMDSQSAYRKRNSQAYASNANEYYNANPWTAVLVRCKSRAKKQGLPFDLDLEYIKSIWTDVCPVLGILMETNRGKGRGMADTSYSLDKIVPELGYVRGNVIVVSGRANKIKTNATAAELAAVAEFYSKLTSSKT